MAKFKGRGQTAKNAKEQARGQQAKGWGEFEEGRGLRAKRIGLRAKGYDLGRMCKGEKLRWSSKVKGLIVKSGQV